MKNLNLNDIITFVNLLDEEELLMLKEVILQKDIEEKESFLYGGEQIKFLEKKFVNNETL